MGKRIVERDHLIAPHLEASFVVVERSLGYASATLLSVPLATMVDEDLPHHARGNAKEVRAVVS